MNKKTVFGWRHKILLSNNNDDDQDAFVGITEIDETFFLRSEKGMKVAVRESIKKGVTILWSDACHTYKGFAKDNEMEFCTINASEGERVKGNYTYNI